MADDSAAPAEERLFAGYAGRVLLLITAGELIVSMGGLVLPPLLPAIIADLAISPARAGLVMTVWWLAIAANNFPGGRLADRLSQKTVIVAGLLVAAAGLAALAGATAYPLLLVGVAVVGTGRGLYQPAAITQISELFVARRGQALGVRNAAFTAGGTAAGGLAVAALAVGTWRTAFLPVAVALVPVVALMHRWNREPYALRRVSFGLRETGVRLVAVGEIRWIVVALSLYGFAWNGTTSFLPAYLQAKGFAPSTASLAFSGLFLVGAAAQPLAGRVGDRTGHLRAAAWAAALSAVGLAILLLAGSAASTVASAAVGLFLLAAGLASFWPVMTAHGMTALPDESRGGDWGAVTAVFIAAESLGSSYVGVVVEALSYDAAYAGLLACFLATVAVTAGLARARRRTAAGRRRR